MLQQVMTNPGEIIFREVPVPEIKDNQVLVKIMNIGICGSDIHVYHGKHPFTKYPVTQGHEVSGEVVKTGDAVTEFHVGQKVTIEPQVYCGHCYPCRHGKYNLCEELKVMGFQTTGTASEYFAVDASKVTPIPEDMSYEEGAMIEPLAVAVHGVKQMGDVTGMNIVVIGAGPIGNLVAQSAKGMGAAKVMITDVSDLRLEKAKECGIDVCVNTRNKNFGEAMVEAFGPDKADAVSYTRLDVYKRQVCKSAYVLEAGEYVIYIGTNVRDAAKIDFTYVVKEDIVTEQLSRKAAPYHLQKRMLADGSYEELPQREYVEEEGLPRQDKYAIGLPCPDTRGQKGIDFLDFQMCIRDRYRLFQANGAML